MLEHEKSKKEREVYLDEMPSPNTHVQNPFINIPQNENKDEDVTVNPEDPFDFKKEIIDTFDRRADQLELLGYNKTENNEATHYPVPQPPQPQVPQYYAPQQHQQYPIPQPQYHAPQTVYSNNQFTRQNENRKVPKAADYMSFVENDPNLQDDYALFSKIYNDYISQGFSFDDSYNVDSKYFKETEDTMQEALYDASLKNSIKRFFKKTFNYKGYASKSEFIKPFLFLSGTVFGSFFLTVIFSVIFGSTAAMGVASLIFLTGGLLSLVSIPSMISLAVRRFRDAGIHPAALLMTLFPFGTLVAFVLGSSSNTNMKTRKSKDDDPKLIRRKINQMIKTIRAEEKKKKQEDKKKARQERMDKRKENLISNKQFFDPDLL